METTGTTPGPIEEQVWDFFKTFVDIDRLRIAGLLGLEAASLSSLAAKLNLRPQAVLNHLERLAAQDLVREHDGLYELNRETFENLARQLLENRRPRVKEEDLQGDEFDRKIQRDFCTPDGRFKALPSQQKKLTVLLRLAAQAFEPGVEYPEKQVNELLRRYYGDTASLRRYMVDAGLLQRNMGVYKLVTPH